MNTIKNNKGYMLVEIIVASAMAIGIAYFIFNLTIKLKNRNDDVFASTLVSTDQAIITNKLMNFIVSESEAFECSNISVEDGKIVKYKDTIIDIMGSSSIVSYDATTNCKVDDEGILIDMPVIINQLIDDYSIHINYRFASNFSTITPSNPQVGDYVYYKPSITEYRTLKEWTGLANYETLNPSELDLWRIIAINADGTIDMISVHVSSPITFNYDAGYRNLIPYLGILASQYEDNDYTVGSRYFRYPADYNIVGPIFGTFVATNNAGQASSYWLPKQYYYVYEQDNGRMYHTYGGWIIYKNGNLAHVTFHGADEGYKDYPGSYSAGLRPIVTLKSGLTFTGKGTITEPHTIQFGQLTAQVDGNNVSAKVTASDGSLLINAVSYEWKVSSDNNCDETTTGFVKTSGNKYTTTVDTIGYYYVCSRIKYRSGDYGYISKKISQLGQYVVYASKNTEYKTIKEYTGLSNYQTINPSELKRWRILNINDNGTVDLISANVSSADVGFYGVTGHSNLVSYLGILSKQYEDPNYTVGSRYINDSKDYDLINYNLGSRIAKDNNGQARAYWLAAVYIRRRDLSYAPSYFDHNAAIVDSNGNYNELTLRKTVPGATDNEFPASAAIRPVVVLRANLTISGSGTINNPINIQNGQLSVKLNGSTLTARATASDGTPLLTAVSFDFKVSNNSTCDENTTGFVRSENDTYVTTVPSIGKYYVCVKIGYGSGEYGYISKSTSQLGQYVSYTPTLTSYNTDKSKTGVSYSQTINPSELTKWRVLAINSDGTVDLVSSNVSSVDISFRGDPGYNNFVSYLSTLAKQYENSNYTTGSRCFGYSNEYDTINYVLGTRTATNNEGQVKSYWFPATYVDRWEQDNGRMRVHYDGRIINSSGKLSGLTLHDADAGYMDYPLEQKAAFRPVVVLKTNVTISGDGTSDNPIRFS